MHLRILLILFIILNPVGLFCQETDTIYYDKDWNTVQDKGSKYYRAVAKVGDVYRTMTYYRSGKIHSSGDYKEKELENSTGPYYYYKKDRVEKIQFYEPSEYPDKLAKYQEVLQYIESPSDSLFLFIEFHKNGKLSDIGYMSGCCDVYGTWIGFYKGGSQSYISNYLDNLLQGHFVLYFTDGSKYCEGDYIMGKKDGSWEYYNFKGQVKRTVIYSQGKKVQKIKH